jgi:transposase InsO family protein
VYNAILVIVDRYTKMNIYIPTTKKCTSVDLAKILRDEIVRHYGIPNGIVSDRGSVFISQYWSDFCYESYVKRKLSTAFYPQTDRQTERANQTLEQYLRCYCSKFQNDWAELLV